MAHAALQPSLGVVLPSSHASVPSMRALPHFWHTLGEPLQLQPASTAHRPLQPSPPVRLPSSHDSGSSRVVLPHWAFCVHTDGCTVGKEQLQPISTVHVAEQPSAGLAPPSSHASLPSTRPLPQRWHTLGEPLHS